MTEEINGRRVKVLPILLKECDIPPFLKDKFFADFRNKSHFDREFKKLLRAMGMTGPIAVHWTDEGPRIIGDGTIISPTEASALLDRWEEWLPKFVEQERQKNGPELKDYWPQAMMLAVIRACVDTYNRAPDEHEIHTLNTELARKFNLFYRFVQDVEVEGFRPEEPKLASKPRWSFRDHFDLPNKRDEES